MAESGIDFTENPFELSLRNVRNSPRRPTLSKTWTDPEKAEKLKNYIEVLPVFWTSIKYGSHIRYVTNEGELKCGYIVKNPFVYKNNDLTDRTPNLFNKEPEKLGFKLQSLFNAKEDNKFVWTVAFSSIKQVYLKVNAETKMLLKSVEETVDSINNNMEKLFLYIKSLEKRISNMETFIGKG